MPHRLLLRICFFGYFVIGLVITVIGPVIPALQEVFGLTRGEVGRGLCRPGRRLRAGRPHWRHPLRSSRAAAGPGRRHGRAFGGLLGLWNRDDLAGGTAFLFCCQRGRTDAESAINSLAVDLGTGARGRILNLLHFFPAPRAVVGPYSADLLLPYGWSTPFLFIGGMLFLFLVLVLLAARRQVGKGSGPDLRARPRRRFNGSSLDARLLTLAALLALYVGAEASITGWTVSYVVDALEASTLAGSTITSLFWLGLMLGRAACARLSQRMDYLSLTAWMGGLAGGHVRVAAGAFNLLARLFHLCGGRVGRRHLPHRGRIHRRCLSRQCRRSDRVYHRRLRTWGGSCAGCRRRAGSRSRHAPRARSRMAGAARRLLAREDRGHAQDQPASTIPAP